MTGFLNLMVDILSEPAVLVALIALIGLAVQKKPAHEIIRGTTKSFLGFVVIAAGAGVLVSSLEPFGLMFQHAFNVDGVVPNNEAIVAMALTEYGTATALIMFFGMFANILIARFTKFKYIFLTGHHTLYLACMFAVILVVAELEGPFGIFIGAIALGLSMAIFPAMAQPFMRKITGTDKIGFGHFSTLGYVLSGLIGKLFKNSKSTEDLKFPKSLSFLRDSSVSISLTMVILYVIVALFTGPTYIEGELSGGKNFIVFSLIEAIKFAAGVFVILQGVRLVIAEIVPAFKGFSEKIVPNAKPALDCPIVFPYAPNAVLLGFFCSFLGGLVGMAILGWVGAIIILPGVVPHFFTGATAGVFGNATGGVKGATVGSFANGLLITFLPVLLMPVLGELGFANTTFSDSDFALTGILTGYSVTWFGAAGIATLVLGTLAIAIIHGVVTKNKDKSIKSI
ncbi:PTS ascorbate transporter subunit IIC [Aquibacillus saliphilus]|uniref:PTS ascorbate transporter subunit IIC n=1 Tax=Aquibacillus saliphilus TaxID=1909422 RepID=UPI001CF0A4BA|nr:PTS ascorbate transporter subunit IIC [Aquibacillus saliphilus]